MKRAAPPEPGDLVEVNDGLPYLAIVKGHREDGRLFVQPVKVTRSFRPRPVKLGEVNAVGEVVLDPFSGLGTVPVRALALGRQGLGVELNGGYFLDAVKYLQAEERKRGMPTLFDAIDEVEAVA